MNKAKEKIVFVTLALIMAAVAANAGQRLVLCEQFTNTSCNPCYNANLTMDQLIENHPDYFALIRYHVNWPSEYDPYYLYNPAENGTRTGYYGIDAVPHVQVDGTVSVENYSQYWAIIQNRYNVDAPLEINLEGSYNYTSRTGDLEVSITATEPITQPGLFIRIALIESNIYWQAPNGLVWHHQVMRQMFPNSTGIRLYIDEGETVDTSVAISCPEPLVIENCELIVFVQAHGTREVLQAAKINITDLQTVDIDEAAALPLRLNLSQNYPNPFNAQTVISYSIERLGPVNLDIFDIAGRKVKTAFDGVLNPGNYHIIWDGTDNNGQPVASGVYLYQLTAEGRSISNMMVLMK